MIEDVNTCKDQIKKITFDVPYLISELKFNFLFVLLENLQLLVIKHKNQRVMKTFDLQNKLPRDVIYIMENDESAQEQGQRVKAK